MSAPPPYEGTVNPDKRPLPDGWITQFDRNYQAWYYVNTRSTPPDITWNHPLGNPPAPPPQFPPPPTAPPVNSGYGGFNSPQGPGYNQGASGGGGYGYNNNQGSYNGGGGSSYPAQGQGQPPYGGGYGETRADSYGGGYNQNSNNYPQQQCGGSSGKGMGGGLLGGLMGGKLGKIGSGGGGGGGYMGGGGGYGQQPPQVVYVQQQPPKKSGGIGMGGLALGAGAGLLGGVLLADALDDDHDDYGGGFGNDGDFGGGDW